MKPKSLLEQARRNAKGHSHERSDWNEVLVGDKSYSMEYPLQEGVGGIIVKNIETTPAFLKTSNKAKCGLCTMWYNKNSVSYTVPNHRILELRRSWNYRQVGKRYESASYKYTNTSVCLFCSQFFSLSEENTCKSQVADNNSGTPLYTTSIDRTDIAIGQKAYQSNEVDGQGPRFAITPPYSVGSKTRREADPWWEIDLGMSYHIHSISISVKNAMQQELEVNIMIFDGPVGFENPFLDSMKDVAIAMHTVTLPLSADPKTEIVEWQLSDRQVAGAVRVQLRGFHTLHLLRFQAFQGDHIHSDNLERASMMASHLSLEVGESGFDKSCVTFDDDRRFNSFASYHPDTFKNCRMYKKRGSKLKQNSMYSRVISSVGDLTQKFKGRQFFVDDWFDRSLEAARYFTTEELVVARDMIFNAVMSSAIDEKRKKMEEDRNMRGMIRRQQSAAATAREQKLNVVRVQDMYGSALMELQPRIPFDAVPKALRTVASQFQGRDQRGEIGTMQRSPRFLFLSLEDTYILDRFETVVECLKAHIQGRGSSSPFRDSFGATSMSLESVDAAFYQEISWSQFVLILYCLSVGIPDSIPPLAFNRHDVDVGPDEHSPSASKKKHKSLKNTASHSPEDDAASKGFSSTASTAPLDDEPSLTPFSRTRPLTPANASPPKEKSKILKALRLPNTRRPSTVSNSHKVGHSRTAPGGLKSHTNSQEMIERPFSVSVRERSKHKTLSLSEKFTKPSKLDVNFSHSQYKLDRIDARINQDVEPRELRTKLTDVNFNEIPGGLSSLDLGLTSGEDMFKIGGGLSATGQSPTKQKHTSPIARHAGSKRSQPDATILNSMQSMDSYDSTSLNGDDYSESQADDVSEVSVNQMLRLQRAALPKPAHLTTQDSFVLKANLRMPHTRDNVRSNDAQRRASLAVLSKSKSSSTFKRMPSITSESDEDLPGPSRSSKPIAFKKSCALCMYKFPVPSMTNKVLLKHVVDLRRIWDPSLVTKFAGHLAEGMSLYNLVSVCHLCYQFFDPDVESGISPPSQSKASDSTKRVIKPRQEPIAFYDDRFSGLKKAGSVLQEEETIALRTRTKKTNEKPVDMANKEQ